MHGEKEGRPRLDGDRCPGRGQPARRGRGQGRASLIEPRRARRRHVQLPGRERERERDRYHTVRASVRGSLLAFNTHIERSSQLHQQRRRSHKGTTQQTDRHAHSVDDRSSPIVPLQNPKSLSGVCFPLLLELYMYSIVTDGAATVWLQCIPPPPGGQSSNLNDMHLKSKICGRCK